MSRVGSGNGSLNVETDFENSFRTAVETRDSIEAADKKANTITSGKSEGFISKKLGNKEL
jgi:hypothetical protein